MSNRLQRAERLSRVLHCLLIQKQQHLRTALANLEKQRQIDSAIADKFDRSDLISPEFAKQMLRRLASAASEIPKAEAAVINASHSLALVDLQVKRAGQNTDLIKADIERAAAEREIQEVVDATLAKGLASTEQAIPLTFVTAPLDEPGNEACDTISGFTG